MDAHTVGNPYVCGLCGNSFSRKDRLQKHKSMLHPGEESTNDFVNNFNLLSCNFCDVMFADKETLEAHKLSHTNVKDVKEEAIEMSHRAPLLLKEEHNEDSES